MPEAEPQFEKTAETCRRLLVLGALVFTAYATTFSILAPGGLWINRVGRAPMWSDRDPGGWYIPSGHELFSTPRSMVFAGHPGLPMQIGLSLIQYAHFLVGGGLQSRLSFTEFAARHVGAVWVLARFLSTAAPLASFLCLYRFARTLSLSTRAASIATITYGTTFPVLYYSSRVSEEPWMVLFFCCTFLALWKQDDSIALGHRPRALAFAALAAAAAVSGAFTKAHLLGLLPLFCLGPLLLQPACRVEQRGRIFTTQRLWAGAVFSGAAIVAILAYSAVMDWDSFLAMWNSALDASVASTGLAPVARNGGVVARLALLLRNVTPGDYVPRVSKAGIFALCELPFVSLSLWGTIALLRQPGRPRRLAWPALYALGTVLVFVYRSHGRGWTGFHYLFIVLPMLAVGCGYLADRTLSRSARSLSRRADWVVLGVLVLTLHGTAIWAATDPRVRDVAEFRRLEIGTLYDTLARLRRGERVLILGTPQLRKLHGLSDSYCQRGRGSTLIDEIERRFVRRASLPRSELTADDLRRGGVAYVLDMRGSLPVLTPAAAGGPRHGGRETPPDPEVVARGFLAQEGPCPPAIVGPGASVVGPFYAAGADQFVLYASPVETG